LRGIVVYDVVELAPATERLRLRPYTLADEAALFEVFSDAYARSFYPEMADRARVRAWIEWNLDNYQEFGFGLWAMELRSVGQFIGDCGLTYQEVEGRRMLELGYHVLESQRGRGYATEAARACRDAGFRNTAEGCIGSIVRPANTASCTVAARVHSERREFMRKGAPAFLFYTTRGDWEARAQNA
jgi:RimJ/RimL family protein N-acetyltransferase